MGTKLERKYNERNCNISNQMVMMINKIHTQKEGERDQVK